MEPNKIAMVISEDIHANNGLILEWTDEDIINAITRLSRELRLSKGDLMTAKLYIPEIKAELTRMYSGDIAQGQNPDVLDDAIRAALTKRPAGDPKAGPSGPPTRRGWTR